MLFNGNWCFNFRISVTAARFPSAVGAAASVRIPDDVAPERSLIRWHCRFYNDASPTDFAAPVAGAPVSGRLIQPEQAVAIIHHGLAGAGQVLLGDFINMAAPAHDQPGEIQLAQMLGGVVVAAAGYLGQFGNGARLAATQFLEHLPAVAMPQAGHDPVNVRAGDGGGGWGCFKGWIHANQRISAETGCKP